MFAAFHVQEGGDGVSFCEAGSLQNPNLFKNTHFRLGTPRQAVQHCLRWVPALSSEMGAALGWQSWGGGGVPKPFWAFLELNAPSGCTRDLNLLRTELHILGRASLETNRGRVWFYFIFIIIILFFFKKKSDSK